MSDKRCKQIAEIVKFGCLKIQSRECQCGIFAYDIVKHCFMNCPDNTTVINTMTEQICDVLSVDTYVSLWSDDDAFLVFLLGGTPNCIVELPFDTWKDVMFIVCNFITKCSNLPLIL